MAVGPKSEPHLLLHPCLWAGSSASPARPSCQSLHGPCSFVVSGAGIAISSAGPALGIWPGGLLPSGCKFNSPLNTFSASGLEEVFLVIYFSWKPGLVLPGIYHRLLITYFICLPDPCLSIFSEYRTTTLVCNV